MPAVDQWYEREGTKVLVLSPCTLFDFMQGQGVPNFHQDRTGTQWTQSNDTETLEIRFEYALGDRVMYLPDVKRISFEPDPNDRNLYIVQFDYKSMGRAVLDRLRLPCVIGKMWDSDAIPIWSLRLTRRPNTRPVFAQQLKLGTDPDGQLVDSDAVHFIDNMINGLVNLAGTMIKSITHGTWECSPGCDPMAKRCEVVFFQTYLSHALIMPASGTFRFDDRGSGAPNQADPGWAKVRLDATDYKITATFKQFKCEAAYSTLALLTKWLMAPQKQFFAIVVDEVMHTSLLLFDSKEHETGLALELFNTKNSSMIYMLLVAMIEFYDPSCSGHTKYTSLAVCSSLQHGNSPTTVMGTCIDTNEEDWACASWWAVYLLLRTAPGRWTKRSAWSRLPDGTNPSTRVCQFMLDNMTKNKEFRSVYTIGTTIAMIGKRVLEAYRDKALANIKHFDGSTPEVQARILFHYIANQMLVLTADELKVLKVPGRGELEQLLGVLMQIN